MSKVDAKTIIVAVLVIVLWFLLMYGLYWTAKTLSYALFYEDMVKQTIVEMHESGEVD